MRNNKAALPLAALAIFQLGCVHARAQTLQIGGKSANYGTVSLSPGFTPDPHTVSITSGGSLDVSGMKLGADCVGYATSQPDLILMLSGSSSQLRFFHESDGDTGLAINDPSGAWHCNDDSYDSVDPTVTINNAPSGQYDVWVTSYTSGSNYTGTLSITELDRYPGYGGGGSSSSSTLNIGGSSSNFGSTTLSPGFTPDPYQVSITSGGSQSVSNMNLGSGCVGYATRDPDFILHLQGRSNMLRFYFVGSGDTGLVINTAGASWRCNDDSYSTTNPTVDINGADAGQYDVWVSSYESGANISGTLYITELDRNHPGG